MENEEVKEKKKPVSKEVKEKRKSEEKEAFDKLKEAHRDLTRIPKSHVSYALEESKVDRAHKSVKKKVQASEDKALKVDFFRWERARKKLDAKDASFLHEYEAKQCKKKCECIRKLPSGAWPVSVGDVVPFDSSYDGGRQAEMYVLYPEKQAPKKYTKQQAILKSKGMFHDDDQVEDGDIETMRFRLVESQFNLYFQEVED